MDIHKSALACLLHGFNYQSRSSIAVEIFYKFLALKSKYMGRSRGGCEQGVWTPPGKSQIAICFLRNNGTDPSRNNWTPRVQGPITSQGRSIINNGPL